MVLGASPKRTANSSTDINLIPSEDSWLTFSERILALVFSLNLESSLGLPHSRRSNRFFLFACVVIFILLLLYHLYNQKERTST